MFKTSVIIFAMVLTVFTFGCSGNSGHADLNSGIRALEQGRNEESLRLLKRATSRGLGVEEESRAHNCVGIAYWRTGKHDMALLAFKTSMDLNPHSLDPVYNIGVMLSELGNSNQAIEFLQKAALIDEDGTSALEYIAMIKTQEKNFEQARKALEEALSRTPRSPKIITAIAVLDLQTGQTEKAAAGFQQALENDSNYPPAIYNLAMLNKQLGKDEQARAYFKEYAGLSKKQSKARLGGQKLKDVSEKIKSIEPEEEPDIAPEPEQLIVAIPHVEEEVKSVEKPVAPIPTYEDRLKTAGLLKDQGRIEAAVHHYLQAVAMAEAAKENDKAQEILNTTIAVSRENARANFTLGSHFLDRKRKEEAKQHFLIASELSKNWAEPLLALGKILAEDGELDAAVVCMKDADRAQPSDPEALWLLANLYDTKMKLTNHAIQCYTWFIRRFPDDSRAESARARLNVLEGKATR